MNKIISIIIVTYKSEMVIKECLESISFYNDIADKLEVIIVDNSPFFEIKEIVDRLNLNLDVKCFHNPENGGFGQGNNIGAKLSSGRILFILNPDTILLQPIFNFIIEEFEDSSLTSAGFRLVGRDDKDTNSVGLLPEYNFFYAPVKLLTILAIKTSFFSRCIFPWGADLIVRKDDFINAGMFDENIFLCNEEPDLMHRLNVNKIKIFDKKIIHLEGHTTDVHELRFYEWFKSTRYYFSKYKLNFRAFYFFLSFKMKIKVLINFFVPSFFSSSKESLLLLNKYKDDLK